MLQLAEVELNNKREILSTIDNSEDYANLKNRIEEQISHFLNRKKDFFKLVATTILNIIRQDPKKRDFH
jgi:hypothetical protein